MLCSILIPSRGKPAACLMACRSYAVTALSHDFQIVLRLDEDDPELPHYKKFSEKYNITTVIKPRGIGYKQLTSYFQDCIDASDSFFCWVSNDDALVDGPWDSEMAFNLRHVVLYPEFHWLNQSRYHNDVHGAFPCFNRDWFKKYLSTIRPGDPIDESIYLKLEEQGIPPVFMKGVSVHHNRNVSPEEERARA